MGQISWGRVVVGGVLWFVVFNVLWAAFWFLFLRSAWVSAFEAATKRPWLETPQWRALWLILTLLAGVLYIWLYAAIRLRYGPGPRTAAVAGVVVWLIGSLFPTLVWGFQLQLPLGLIAEGAVGGLVAVVVATLVGAWSYKE